MRIQLEFTESQADVFQDMLEATLASLVYQEATLKDAVADKDITPAQLDNVNEFLPKVTSQRILTAEILSAVMEAERKTRIITT